MLEVCVCSLFDGTAVARLDFAGLLKGCMSYKFCERFETYWGSRWHLDVICSSERYETIKPTICQDIQNPSFQIAFNKSSCHQALVRHPDDRLLILIATWLAVALPHFATSHPLEMPQWRPSPWQPVCLWHQHHHFTTNGRGRASEFLTLKSCCVIR